VKRSVAAFTIARNEQFFLRLWCNYYCKVIGQEDVYVVDNGSNDGSIKVVQTLWPNINIISRPSSDTCNWLWLKNLAEEMQRMLLRSYEVVVFSDADEFLFPKNESLLSYIENFKLSSDMFKRAHGWNIVHQVDTEPTLLLNAGQHVLQHRDAMWRMKRYDKTLITKVPLSYSRGFHVIYQDGKHADNVRDDGLDMLHAWQIDVTMFHERYKHRYATFDNMVNTMNGSADMSQTLTYFRTNQHWDKTAGLICEGDRQHVPQHWRNALIW
jgi:hypothetical protein